MIELGQLETNHAEFEKRKVNVVAISVEDQTTAKETQEKFPHLKIVADPEKALANSVQIVHPQSAPDGSDTAAPTTVLVDGQGKIRWVFRPDNVFRRLSPAEALTAVDEHLKKS